MAYESFYTGANYSLDPGYTTSSGYGDNFIGYQSKLKDFGLTTDGRTANLLQELAMKFNTGVKVMELSGGSPDVFDAIPEQHLEEVKRMSKLVGAETTLHAPMVEATGFSKQGWNETDRQFAERQISQVVERAHKLSPKGNIPITFHSTYQLPEANETIMEKVDGEYKQVPKSMIIVDPRTGRTDEIREIQKFFPGETGKFDPKKELEKRNKDIWTKTIGDVNFSAYRGEQVIKAIDNPVIFENYGFYKNNPDKINQLPDSEKTQLENNMKEIEHAHIFLRDAYMNMKELYNMVARDAGEEDKIRLSDFAKEITPLVEQGGFESDPNKLQELSSVIQKGLGVLGNLKEPPKIYIPLNDFMIEKSAKTYGNAAFSGYEKFKDTAPIISIENPPAGGGISKAEDLRKLVEEARDVFVKKAIEQGISNDEAKKASEKLIGATWDVGHINMLRKYGYQSKDIVKETEKIAPVVKHVHLSDNFGFEHTELPMGMGNVPIKEMMEKLGKEGFKGKKIIEAFQWWQHFKTPPLVPTLEAFGSPLYSADTRPYWNQISNVASSYFSGYGPILPEQHFSMYGTGFSGMPLELGGQMPGKSSRMSGTPMD